MVYSFLRSRGSVSLAALVALAALALSLLLAGCEQSARQTIENFKDAEYARFGLVTGTVTAQIARERFPEASFKEFSDTVDILGAMKAGHVDAMLTDIYSAFLAAGKHDYLRVIDEPIRKERTCIAVRKGNSELLAAVNAVIAAAKVDGTLADMGTRWLKSEPGPYLQRAITLPEEGQPLRIGVNASREPVIFVDGNQQISGHDAEMARELGARLNRPVEFYDMRWDALIPALQSGKLDLIVSGMSYTSERAQRVDFTENYYETPLVMLVRVEDKKSSASSPRPALRSNDDLVRARIGVIQGSAHDVFVQHNLPEAELLQFIGISDLIVAVETDKVDAGIMDEDVLNVIVGERPLLQKFGESLFTAEVGAGFNKRNGALREQFNAFLDTIRSNGTYDDMVQRWLRESSTVMPELSFDPAAPPLKIGNSIGSLPQVGLVDNQLVGFDVEMAVRFAQYAGMRPDWHTVEWGALLPALAAGKTDMIVSSMFITEERRERIDFSDPYFTVGNYFFVKPSRVTGNVEAVAAPTDAGFIEGMKSSFYSNLILEDRYLLLLDGLKITVILSIFSSLFGTALGAGVCAMRMSSLAVFRIPARIYISIMRGIPVLVLLMLIFYVLFASVNISPVFVAIIAFGLHFAAYVAEIFRTGVESIDDGQTEAGVSLGFTRLATFIYIVLPQTIQRILPVYKGEFISMVKMTSIVGYVAVQDLTKASDIIRARTFDAFFPLVMVAILYFLIAWLMLQVLEYLERRTDPLVRRQRRARG